MPAKKKDQEVTEEVVTETTEPVVEEVEVIEEPQTEGSKPAAKAGKRSAKAVREADAEEDRKEKAAIAPEAPKPKVQHTPNPKNRHGKNYLDALAKVDRTKQYEIDEAIALAKETAKVKFDPSVELHMNLGVDPRQADQMVRATVQLPAGTGKTLKIAVVAPSEKQAEAKKAGADIAGDAELIAEISKGKTDFDILIATPDMMAQLSKAAKVLGPRGLMPNPKSGTVSANVASAVEQAKAGRVEFRIDKQAIVHLAVGKASFTPDKLKSNLLTAIDAVMKAKPSAAKGTYVKAISITTSMGPGIKLDIQKAIAEANSARK